MLTHSQYDGEDRDYDHFYSLNSRQMSHAVPHYDRAAPYSYYHHPLRHESRSKYPGHPTTRKVIHEPEEPAPIERGTRKRISVACRRCRKRKIRCSGDAGDGLGCSHCREAGPDGEQCQFIRVGASELYSTIEITPISSNIGAPSMATHRMDTQPNILHGRFASGSSNDSGYDSRKPSLPTLHTRSAYPNGYEVQYENAPMDGYSYAPPNMPRHDSFTSTYGLENYRSWSTTAPVTTSMTAAYYEPTPPYSFGSLQAPAFPQIHPYGTRLPSVTAESFSPFHMSHLNSSLPMHAAHERRLPAPYTLHYPSVAPQPLMPQIKPLGSYYEPKLHISNIYKDGRMVMPWSFDTSSGTTRTASISHYTPSSGFSGSSAQQTTTAVSEPTALGYQFNLSTPTTESSSSPEEISPTSGSGSVTSAATNESFSSDSVTPTIPPPPPPSLSTTTSYQYPCTSSGYSAGTTISIDPDRPSTTTTSASSYPHPPSLFSLSTDSGDDQASFTTLPEQHETAYHLPIRVSRAGGGEISYGYGHEQSHQPNQTAFHHHHHYHPPQQPPHHEHQPQQQYHRHHQRRRRLSSYTDEHRRISTAHRMALSNLDANFREA